MISGKKVLVTGANGFVGRALAKRLCEASNEVTATARSPFDAKVGDHAYDNIDLRNFDECKRMVKGQEYVFHLAANIGGIAYITQSAADIIHDNRLINLNMLKACAQEGVKRLFFSSSVCVYPEGMEGHQFSELDTSLGYPTIYYGWEKLYTEKECEAYEQQYGLQTRIARFDTIYGPNPHKARKEKVPEAICRKVINAKEGEKIEVWGDGTQTRCFLYIDDAVDATIRLMELEKSVGPINISSGNPVTISQLVDTVIAISAKSVGKRYDTSKPQGVKDRWISIEKAKRELGWAPTTGLTDGIRELYEFLREESVRSQKK